MPCFRLRILKRPLDGRSGVATDSDWIEASTPDEAIAQAKVITDAVLADSAGVSMLLNEQDVPLWSERKRMPRPHGLGGF